MSYKTLKDIGEMKGKKVLVRVDFNVPINEGRVEDPFRIEKSLPTITFLREKGAKILLIAHIEDGPTLRPVADYLSKYFPVAFSEDFFGSDAVAAISALEEGGVLLFENLRNNKGEKENDQAFAKNLAALGELYVNDGFAVSHRSHASVVGVPQFLPSYAGLLLQSEIENLTSVFNPPHPFLFILGGAKFDTKLPLIQKFLKLADKVFIGGALANDFFKEEGYEIGTSLYTEGDFHIKELLANDKLVIPIDVTAAEGDRRTIKEPNEVLPTENILDVGPETVMQLKEIINGCECVLWNGPLGNYEKGFVEPTIELAKILAASSAKSVVGGGDTLAAIAASGVEDQISFISTGGGAMLQFLLEETLPGIEALKNNSV